MNTATFRMDVEKVVRNRRDMKRTVINNIDHKVE
jgi:hypothetical protein